MSKYQTKLNTDLIGSLGPTTDVDWNLRTDFLTSQTSSHPLYYDLSLGKYVPSFENMPANLFYGSKKKKTNKKKNKKSTKKSIKKTIKKTKKKTNGKMFVVK